MLHMETGVYRTAFGGLFIYFYIYVDFPTMLNWNIVCNNNLDHILKVNCDILMNNI